MTNKPSAYLRKNSTILRNNMTTQEKRLWYDFLKKLPVTVRRQQIIDNYIVDFFIPEKRTVIEIDGIQHTMESNELADYRRDEYLSSIGISVLRYTNEAINKEFNVVCNEILNCLEISADDLK